MINELFQIKNSICNLKLITGFRKYIIGSNFGSDNPFHGSISKTGWLEYLYLYYKCNAKFSLFLRIILGKQRMESTSLILSKRTHIHKASSATLSLLSSLLNKNHILSLRFVKLRIQLGGIKDRTFFLFR